MSTIPKVAKEYADAIYLKAAQSSGKQYRDELQASQRDLSARGVSDGGMAIRSRMRLYSEHIGRLLEARLSGFQQAFKQMTSVPSEEQLQEIWNEIRSVYENAVTTGNKEIEDLAKRRKLPGRADVSSGAGHHHDEVLNLWKIWRAESQLSKGQKIHSSNEPHLPLDSLTRVFTREALDNHLNYLSTPTLERPLAVMMVDLDGFKSVNDSKGHSAGDKVLASVGEILGGVASGKGKAFRYGGDEFTVLLENHNLGEANAVAERIRSAIEKLEVVTASIGVAVSTGAESLEQLRENADKAAYDAKNSGKNRVVSFGSHLHTANMARRRTSLLDGDLKLRLDQAHAGYFLLNMQNRTPSEVEIERIQVKAKKSGVILSEGTSTDPNKPWLIPPNAYLTIDWQSQKDPVYTLCSIDNNYNRFNCELDFYLTYLSPKGRELYPPVTIPVRVEWDGRRIWEVG
jgi:diguanylate cyclase (GGDEF)-like protein